MMTLGCNQTPRLAIAVVRAMPAFGNWPRVCLNNECISSQFQSQNNRFNSAIPPTRLFGFTLCPAKNRKQQPSAFLAQPFHHSRCPPSGSISPLSSQQCPPKPAAHNPTHHRRKTAVITMAVPAAPLPSSKKPL